MIFIRRYQEMVRIIFFNSGFIFDFILLDNFGKIWVHFNCLSNVYIDQIAFSGFLHNRNSSLVICCKYFSYLLIKKTLKLLDGNGVFSRFHRRFIQYLGTKMCYFSLYPCIRHGRIWEKLFCAGNFALGSYYKVIK